tara:strand:+ start:6101 stop:7588 length:1488 start_codon:yes stop_codon:yes gene_type:complete
VQLQKSINQEIKYDAVLVGAGIMSTTLAILITEILPNVKILIIEKLESAGLESTGAFNNAGTGHAANCELNYTPINKDGNFQMDKALKINNAFEITMEFWASLYKSDKIDIGKFLKFIPHISFVNGKENSEFLYRRYLQMREYREFENMEFSSSFDAISSWAPLITMDRDIGEKIAATRIKRGTDINFEALTHEYLSYLRTNKNVEIKFSTELINLKRYEKNNWELFLKQKDKEIYMVSNYIFLGAGGDSIKLLQKSKIPEGKLYGGFPVSGKWLITDNVKLTSQHNSKVYGKAEIGSPPMSVPHLDARWIKGKKFLLYGPFAGATTKFLKKGSHFDLFNSFKKENILSIFDVGFNNFDLINYLISQSLQNHSSRIKSLRKMMPSALSSDWSLRNAGQRVQIIKKTKQGGVLKFGTEVVNSEDGSLTALLGASPGASTSVQIMIEVLKKSCFIKKENISIEKNLSHLLTFNNPLNKDYQENIKRRNNDILGFHED